MKLNKFLTALSSGIILSSTAMAAPAGAPSTGSALMQMLPMFVLLIAVFYFLLIRPQSKRAKEHRKLMAGISIGDEVVTTCGMVGRIVKLKDDFFVLATGKDVQINFQKSAIQAILPKGTIDNIV